MNPNRKWKLRAGRAKLVVSGFGEPDYKLHKIS
jgi:hypothetical protein